METHGRVTFKLVKEPELEEYISCDLIHIDLSQNGITHLGAKMLFNALKRSHTLISLNLGNTGSRNRNAIGAKGAKYLKELLLVNQILSFVDIRGNSICDQGMF